MLIKSVILSAGCALELQKFLKIQMLGLHSGPPDYDFLAEGRWVEHMQFFKLLSDLEDPENG